MLFIDADELRKKGNIVLLGGGVILDGITEELLKVLDNIEDVATDPEKNRKIKIEFTIKPNYNRDKVSISCDVSSTLAAKNVLQMRMNLEKAIDGEVIQGESVEIHESEKATIVDADFVEKDTAPEEEDFAQDEMLTEDFMEVFDNYETEQPTLL